VKPFISTIIHLICGLLFAATVNGCSAPKATNAKLDFPLPRHARYTVTDEKYEAATALLQQDFLPDTNKLKAIISAPAICGPRLWLLLKDSPHFATPLIAKSTGIIPLANGRTQEVATALIQNESEADNFRAALADLLAENGELKFRLPTEDEFKLFWVVIPFDTISDPLIVAEGKRYNLIMEFAKGKPFWFDEVKITPVK
jgi:hypothetical protein